jgi:hypothetical protein
VEIGDSELGTLGSSDVAIRPSVNGCVRNRCN